MSSRLAFTAPAPASGGDCVMRKTRPPMVSRQSATARSTAPPAQLFLPGAFVPSPFNRSQGQAKGGERGGACCEYGDTLSACNYKTSRYQRRGLIGDQQGSRSLPFKSVDCNEEPISTATLTDTLSCCTATFCSGTCGITSPLIFATCHQQLDGYLSTDSALKGTRNVRDDSTPQHLAYQCDTYQEWPPSLPKGLSCSCRSGESSLSAVKERKDPVVQNINQAKNNFVDQT